MNEWKMTDKQIWELTVDCYAKPITQGHDVAKAAQKKLVTWLCEGCDTSSHVYNSGWMRVDCADCMYELRKELGL
jgi:ribosomal protein S27E